MASFQREQERLQRATELLRTSPSRPDIGIAAHDAMLALRAKCKSVARDPDATKEAREDAKLASKNGVSQFMNALMEASVEEEV